ncbi:MAG: heme oxygenase [Bacteroidetes bacterium]|nr:MAG: heme oxygenase [Bacteroidota bacterium]
MNEIERIKNEIEPLRQALLNHKVYKEIKTVEDLNIFLEHHVFAVWDFMSLLKALQRALTCVSVPWVPKGNPIVRKLINEIVLGEETDVDITGNPMSHFELYIDAMKATSANRTEIESFIVSIKSGEKLKTSLHNTKIPKPVREFVEFTFDIIETNKPHKIAAAFTFGREDLIPDMFNELIQNLDEKFPNDLTKLIYYLDRHIEVDAEVHGPMAMEMIRELCENNPEKWQECLQVSRGTLQKRIELWDAILEQINKRKQVEQKPQRILA